MSRKQWVNFPPHDMLIGAKNVVRSKYVDDDVSNVDVMGPNVYVKVRYKKSGATVPVEVTLESDGANAKYSAAEQNSAPGVYGPTIDSATGVGIDGEAKFHVRLTPAGGDRYKIKAKSKKGTELVCKEEIETRRKLYYQVIRMAGAGSISASDLARVEKEFWNPAKKVYIKLEQYSPGGTIFDLENFDDTHKPTLRRVRDAARAVFDTSKAPFSIAVVIVNKNCIPKWESKWRTGTITGSAVNVPLDRPLFYYADPSVPWFGTMTYTPEKGPSISIPSHWVAPADEYTVTVDARKLPKGRAMISYELLIVDFEGMGLSIPTENLVTVSSRGLRGKKVSSRTMAGILVHEIGHKLGMVPGRQGDRDLDEQSSYYDGRGHAGGHCRHPAPLLDDYRGSRPIPPPECTMFGDIRTQTTKFCSLCEQSIRKLDVSPHRKHGIATMF